MKRKTIIRICVICACVLAVGWIVWSNWPKYPKPFYNVDTFAELEEKMKPLSDIILPDTEKYYVSDGIEAYEISLRSMCSSAPMGYAMAVKIGDEQYVSLRASQIDDYTVEYNKVPKGISATEEYKGVGIEIDVSDLHEDMKEEVCRFEIVEEFILDGYWYWVHHYFEIPIEFDKADKGYGIIDDYKACMTEFVHSLIDKGLEKEGRK